MAAPIPFVFQSKADGLVHSALFIMNTYRTECRISPWQVEDYEGMPDYTPITCLGCLARSSEDTIQVKAVTGRMSSTASNLTPKK